MSSPKKIYTYIYLEDNVTSHVSTALPCTVRITNQALQNHETNLEMVGVSLLGLASFCSCHSRGWAILRYLHSRVFRWTLSSCSPVRLLCPLTSPSSSPSPWLQTTAHTEIPNSPPCSVSPATKYVLITASGHDHSNDRSYLGLVHLIIRFWHELVIYQKDTRLV